jgi:hypothetical protein
MKGLARHQHDIAPLLKNRRIFAESTHFVLYDFWTDHGTVDENVFAYSNSLLHAADQRIRPRADSCLSFWSTTIMGWAMDSTRELRSSAGIVQMSLRRMLAL